MTINHAQGQLYVALSRVTARDNMKALLPDNDLKTVNIIYEEVLLQ